MADNSQSSPQWLGWKWWLFIGLVATTGLSFLLLSPQLPKWITRSTNLVPQDKWHVLIAIFMFTIVGGHVFAHFTTLGLAYLFDLKKGINPANLYTPAFVGFCESILYPTSFLLDIPEFIGIWLALKVAGHWKQWETGDEGRRRFNKFLVGNAMSICVGILSYGAIKSFVLYECG